MAPREICESNSIRQFHQDVMIKGTVKFFNNAKGFGFITPDDGGKDVFVPAATITTSNCGRLKAGQRVSFQTEPDPKGPKAVKLTLLDEAPREVVKDGVREGAREGAKDGIRDAAKESVKENPALVLYHDADSEESAEVLEALKAAGQEARQMDVIETPPGREELRRLSLLLREADQSLVRRYDSLFLALQLDDRFISESEFWQAIFEHPQLINAPVLATANKARLVRSAADVRAFLGGPAELNDKPKGLSPRMAALMKGHALPPKPEIVPQKIEPAPKPAAKAEPKAKAVPEAKPKKAVPEKKAAKPLAKKMPAAKPAAKPAKQAVKKALKKK
jgi:CspA family cold shock protein